MQGRDVAASCDRAAGRQGGAGEEVFDRAGGRVTNANKK